MSRRPEPAPRGGLRRHVRLAPWVLLLPLLLASGWRLAAGLAGAARPEVVSYHQVDRWHAAAPPVVALAAFLSEVEARVPAGARLHVVTRETAAGGAEQREAWCRALLPRHEVVGSGDPRPPADFVVAWRTVPERPGDPVWTGVDGGIWRSP